MKLAFFEVEKWEKEILTKAIRDLNLEIYITDEKLDSKNAEKFSDYEIISCFIYSKIDKDCLKKLKKVKMICTRSTGFDHIDLKESKLRKINVSNVPSYGENTVAEFTFGLILMLSRKLNEACQKPKRNDFSLENLMGFDLKGKTIGIVGTGKIGRNVARIAKGFEMNVIAYDLFKSDEKIKYLPLNDLLKKSDIISLHIPYSRKTHHLINKKTIKLIKRGAILINTARGGLIETEALISAIDQGILAGAGLDVLEKEPLIKEENQLLSKNFDKKTISLVLKDHILINKKNVIVTPHSAFYSKEAIEKIDNTTVDNILGYLKNKLINKIV